MEAQLQTQTPAKIQTQIQPSTPTPSRTEIRSLGDMLRRTCLRVPEKVAMLSPDKDGFREIKYRELYEFVRRYATVLASTLGVNRGDKVCMVSENCAEWAIADWACQCMGVVLVPIYPTLTADQIAYIVRDCKPKVVLAGSPELMEKAKDLEGTRPFLLKGQGSLDELAQAVGEPMDLGAHIDATQPQDLATIIYTSGTTGVPKGAMMPHRAFVHVCVTAQRHIPLNEHDTFLTFLPMSHVYERVAGQCLPVCLGATIAYAKSLASMAGDIVKVRPTVMLCVPRFLESFRDRVLDNVKKSPPLRQKLFHLAISQGVRKARGGFAPWSGVLDKIVMAKLRARLGGRMRFFVSGGAALPRHVAEFYIAAGLTVLQGYGLTETSGGTCINRPENNKYWTVGEPLDMEIKIAEDGEILIRGAALMLGYHDLPEETAQAIDAEGWFHSGDIGEFEATNLKITDRKKDLIILGNGKNVAPQPIENRLRESDLITEAVVLGDGMEHCVALIVPNFDAVRAALSLPADAPLSQSPEAKALIKKEIDRVNKQLAGFEAVKKHAILDAPFTIESGELTPTLKVKRKVVAQKYEDLLKALRG